MKQSTITSYLKLIPFENFNLWDVKRYYTKSNLQFENVVTLGDILKPYKKAVSKEEMIKNKWQIISKINFGGELFLRDFEEIKTYKGNVNLVPDNAIIYSKINVRHGCIYFHEKGQTPFGVSSEYPTFLFDETKINGKFLHKVLRSSAFKTLLNSKTTGISKARVKQDEFLDIQIPLPPIKVQEEIVINYYSKIKEAEELEKQANDLDVEIEKVIFSELDIKEYTDRLFSKKIKTVNSAEIGRWGVEFILGSNSSQFLKSKKFTNNPLKNIVQINPKTSLPIDNIPISFLPMECISDEYGEVIEYREKLSNDSKGYTRFINGDLLWARITPCMQNGKSAIVKNLKNGFGCGSTEYHVIRNNNPEIDLEYIYHLLRLKTVLANAKSHFTGSAGQQRVPKSFLEDLEIPVPSINEQKAISEKISSMKTLIKQYKINAEASRQKAQQEFENEIFAS
ncbi:MAG: restriction endonuclease subunit S [Bacteroidales bacterium]|nr:restriction endonuclease subunit S [Bacteroidales bacterium]